MNWLIPVLIFYVALNVGQFLHARNSRDYCGRSIIGGEWVYGRLRRHPLQEEAYILFDDGSMVEVSDSSLRCSTGCKDRYDRLIYTDDQCKLFTEDGEEQGRIEIKHNDTWFKSRRLGKLTRLSSIDSERLEITDNRCPELKPEDIKQIEGGAV